MGEEGSGAGVPPPSLSEEQLLDNSFTANALAEEVKATTQAVIDSSSQGEVETTIVNALSYETSAPVSLETALTEAVNTASTTIADLLDRPLIAGDDIGSTTALAETAQAESQQILGLRKEYIIIIVLTIVAVALTIVFLVIILAKRRALARRQRENVPESVPLKDSKA